MKNIIYLVWILLLVIFSCTNASESDLMDVPPSEDIITYKDHVKAIIDNNCISCHSNPPVNGAPDALTTYEDVKFATENHNLIGRINANDGTLMPFGGPKLPESLIETIMKWEADGLLEE